MFFKANILLVLLYSRYNIELSGNKMGLFGQFHLLQHKLTIKHLLWYHSPMLLNSVSCKMNVKRITPILFLICDIQVRLLAFKMCLLIQVHVQKINV